MKYCPNPDCAGLAKFGIVSEFNDTSDICSDCETPLADGPAPAPEDLAGRVAPEPEMELVHLVSIAKEAELVLVESLLEEAGIPYLAKGEHIQDLFGMGRITVVNPIVGRVQVEVRSDDLQAAREILADFVD